MLTRSYIWMAMARRTARRRKASIACDSRCDMLLSCRAALPMRSVLLKDLFVNALTCSSCFVADLVGRAAGLRDSQRLVQLKTDV